MQAFDVLIHTNSYGLAQFLQYWEHRSAWGYLQDQVQNKKSHECQLHNHLFQHPQLFGSGWEPIAKDQSLQTAIEKLGGKVDRRRKDLQMRADLVLRKDDNLLVVEIMRPGSFVNSDHINRMTLYKAYLTGYLQTYKVRGFLIADHSIKSINPGLLEMLKNLPSSNIKFVTWQEFIQMTKPEFRFEVTRFLDSAVNQIAGLLPPSSDPPFEW